MARYKIYYNRDRKEWNYAGTRRRVAAAKVREEFKGRAEVREQAQEGKIKLVWYEREAVVWSDSKKEYITATYKSPLQERDGLDLGDFKERTKQDIEEWLVQGKRAVEWTVKSMGDWKFRHKWVELEED